MIAGGDERGVTVQIGAVLLLAIVFSSLALYQINAVPVQNEAVEIEHNEEVHNEMQDLRNAIQNVGMSGESRSTSVTLGTQYQPRAFTSNPPNPRGTLQTSEAESIRIDNVTIEDSYSVTEDELTDLIEDLETRSIVYEPGYNEYTQAPVTRIEHGFAFNDFDGSSVGLTSKPVVDGTDLTIIQLDGNLSETSSGAVSVDARLESGPTDPVTIESGDDGVIELPTQTWDAWNKSIDRSNVTIDEGSEGALRIELDDDEEYELQMMCVVVGDGTGDGCGDFDITEETDAPLTEENASVLPGPEVTELELDPNSVTKGDGDEVKINASFSNLGTTDEWRGGTPIERGEWYIEEEGEPEPGEGNELSSQPDENFGERQVDTNGTIDIDDLGLDAGDYTVSVRAQDTRGVWTNESADGKTKTFTVVETGSFSGVVEDDDGDPISQTDVNFEADDGTFEETVETNADGEYTIEDVEEGTYDITASADGFEDDTNESVEITSGEETEDVDFTLGAKPSFDSLSAEVTDYNQGHDAIREVNIIGSVENVDNDGFIEIEFTGDVEEIEGDTERQIGMVATFDEDFDTGSGNDGPGELGVIVRLLDEEENLYITCISDEDLIDGDSELTLEGDDFTCD